MPSSSRRGKARLKAVYFKLMCEIFCKGRNLSICIQVMSVFANSFGLTYVTTGHSVHLPLVAPVAHVAGQERIHYRMIDNGEVAAVR